MFYVIECFDTDGQSKNIYKHVLINAYLRKIFYGMLSFIIKRKPTQYPCELITHSPCIERQKISEVLSLGFKSIVKYNNCMDRVLYSAIYNKETKETIDITYFFNEVAIEDCVRLTAGELIRIISSSWYFYLASFAYRRYSSVYRIGNGDVTGIIIVIINSNLKEIIYELNQTVRPWVN
jgi:hypothetical protein